MLLCASNSELFFNNVCCAPDGLVAQAKINVLPCQQDDVSQGGERGIQMPNLPEVRYDILLTLGSLQVKCQ